MHDVGSNVPSAISFVKVNPQAGDDVSREIIPTHPYDAPRPAYDIDGRTRHTNHEDGCE